MTFEAPPYPQIFDQTLTETSTLPDFVLYIFNFAVGLGIAIIFISLAIAGVMYFFSGVSGQMQEKAKDRVVGSISGLLILLCTYLIITTINPQLSVFRLGALPEQKVEVAPITNTTSSGVYFFNNVSCDLSQSQNFLLLSNSTDDLNDFKKKALSAKIIQGNDLNSSYVSIAYENPDLFGKCQYISPRGSCDVMQPPFASSASVHIFDFEPNGDGVYFFRKPCYNKDPLATIGQLINNCKEGGYYFVPNNQIKPIFDEELSDLLFTGVPTEEKTCTKYDSDGKCVSRLVPSLDGENISSFIINGNYTIVFYYAEAASEYSPSSITSCQEFPKLSDKNKKGPFQIKWQNIRNYSASVGEGGIPNSIAIFPIKN